MTGIETEKISYPMEGFCNAKNRQGLPCRKRPVNGRKRCANHGGKSLQMEAHGRYKYGLHTDEMIQLRKQYRQDMKLMKEYIRMIS